MTDTVNIIGAGLAGCEAAYQASKRGCKVKLYDMKPSRMSEAHKSADFAELVCSNSLKSDEVTSSGGLLKAEMRLLDSLILKIAAECKVDAGGALAVDRELFSAKITAFVRNDPGIQVIEQEITDLNFSDTTIVSTGPLTGGALYAALSAECGGFLSFFDASAPIVAFDSLDMERCFFGARYGKGSDYINCPLEKDEYAAFVTSLISADTVIKRDFEKDIFEGCMPVECMAARGPDTLRFGPLKPVGLFDERTGRRPYAAVQLRAENAEKKLYNLVGFQTNLKFPEQKRVFSMIPALKNAEFTRFGVMHRNSFINAPAVLDGYSALKSRPHIFIAGQLSGVEGYMESALSGLLAGINAARRIEGKALYMPPADTMSGALMSAVLHGNKDSFQPVPVSFGLLPDISSVVRDKALRKEKHAESALLSMRQSILTIND